MSPLDFNKDGAISVADIWSWCAWLFNLPGDMFLSALTIHAPAVARFFEIIPSNSRYVSLLTFFISLGAWWLLTAVLTREQKKTDTTPDR